MDFSIIIVSWKVREKLRANLKALLASSREASFEIIIIDNNSGDGTLEMLRDEFSDCRLIANSENAGFARACNQGLREAKGEIFLLLNPDMEIRPDTLANLKKWLAENPQADVAGIRLLDERGENLPQVRRFPNFWNQLAVVLKIPHLFPNVLADYLRADFDYSHAAKVDSIRGAFFAIRPSAIERFGYLDERYFIWFEEVDYCRTVAKNGGEVWYTPAAAATDYVGQSFSQVGQTVKQNYFKKSMLAYFKKWEPAWQSEVLAWAWDLSEVIVSFADIFKVKPRAKT